MRSRLDKLGVKPGMHVALVGLDERDFVRELKQRTPNVTEGRARKQTEMIFLGVEKVATLSRLATLQRAIVPNGAIWAIWPKGQKHITEGMIAMPRSSTDSWTSRWWRSPSA
jgi:hypothetical protein